MTLVGKPGWGVTAFVERMKSHPEFGRRLHWYSSMSDTDLATEYQKCDALIAASFGEGFGLPIVEAQQRGKPIIASDLKVFREISGDGTGITFFETGSPTNLAETISDFSLEELHVPDLTHVLSWDESASALHKVISDQNWYKVYRGRKNAANAARAPIGVLRTDREVTDCDNTRNSLELVGERCFDQIETNESVVVKARNTSSLLWSSQGDKSVTLRVFGDNQKGRTSIAPRIIQIPLVLAPGEEQYFNLGTANELRQLADEKLEVSFWQDHKGRIGRPLILAIERQQLQSQNSCPAE